MIEVLKQMVEALEVSAITADNFLVQKKTQEAIQAGKQAIAELESQDDGYCQACDGALCTAKKGCVALSNPPQRTEEKNA